MTLKNVTALAKCQLVLTSGFAVCFPASKRSRGSDPPGYRSPDLSELPTALKIARERIQRRRIGLMCGEDVREGRTCHSVIAMAPLERTSLRVIPARDGSRSCNRD